MNIRIGHKLGAIIGLWAFSAVGLSAFSFWQSRLQEQESTEIQKIYNFALEVRGLTQSVEHVVVVVNAAVTSDDKDAMKAKLTTLDAALDQLKNASQSFLAHSGENIPEDQKTRLGLELKEFIAYQNDTAQLGLTISPKAALVQANDDATVKNREKMISQMEAFAQSALDRLAKVRTANSARRQKIEAYMIGVQACVIAAGVLIAIWVFTTQIRRPLRNIIAAMQRVARGDLNVRIPFVSNSDEIGELAQALVVFRDAALTKNELELETQHRRNHDEQRRAEEQAAKEAMELERATVIDSIGIGLASLAAKDLTYRMSGDIPDAYRKLQADFNASIEELEAAMRKVAESSDTIHSGTRDISTAADDLSRRTEQQAASLEETAAALGEITTTVKKSAEGAAHARAVVAAANEDANKSSAVVRQAVDAMGGIAQSAQQISQIIGVIDEIAFQTNLLALNAGVEAARAGDAGRGFAVVASEVRALAQRSAEAAKEIKSLISASTAEVEQGVRLVGETGKSLERMLAQVGEINDIVTAIATGAREQSTGLAEVNTALGQMDQMTQQNSAVVEESTAASYSLSQETDRLSALIGRFKLSGNAADGSLRSELQNVAPCAFQTPLQRRAGAA